MILKMHVTVLLLQSLTWYCLISIFVYEWGNAFTAVKDKSDVPVIMVTSRDSEADEVLSRVMGQTII